jgi:hypothetical protein
MNKGMVRLGNSTRKGTQVQEPAFRVGPEFHYFLTGPRY